MLEGSGFEGMPFVDEEGGREEEFIFGVGFAVDMSMVFWYIALSYESRGELLFDGWKMWREMMSRCYGV